MRSRPRASPPFDRRVRQVRGPMGTRLRKSSSAKPVTSYEPTEAEKPVVERVRKKAAERGVLNRVRVIEGCIPRLEPGHVDPFTGASLQMDALGLSSYEGYGWFIGSVANAVTTGRKVEESDLNGALGFIKGMQPRDDMEALLLSQMVAVHKLTMTFARRLNHVENIPQQDSASNALNKLARTFTTQMQTFKQYRTGGEQRVIVQRVDVRDGGQAIVGAVNHSSPGGGGEIKTGGQPHALANTRGSEMLCEVQEERAPVSGASGPGQVGVQDARRSRRRP